LGSSNQPLAAKLTTGAFEAILLQEATYTLL